MCDFWCFGVCGPDDREHLWNPGLFHELTPGRCGDDIFYDNLAYHLVLGEGFRLNFADADWLQAYQGPRNGELANSIVTLDVQGVTATRAPGYPCFLAAVYHQFGRDWNVIYFLQWIILCATLTTLLILVCRTFGIFAATIATVTIACDFGVLTTISQLMTEALATSLASLTFCCLIWAWNHPQTSKGEVAKLVGRSPRPVPFGLWRWAILGMLFGLMIQFRTNFAAWFVMFCVLAIPWMIILQVAGKQASRFLISFAIFFLTVVIICLPWSYRNCVVLEKFQALGYGGQHWLGGWLL